MELVRERGRVGGVGRRLAVGSLLAVAVAVGPGARAWAADAGPGASVPVAAAGAGSHGPLDPVSTAAIGSVFVAVAFWARSRRRARDGAPV